MATFKLNTAYSARNFQLHKNFWDFAVNKLYYLFEPRKPWITNTITKRILEWTQAKRDDCQWLAEPLIRFKLSLLVQNELRSAKDVSIKIIFVDRKTVLYVIDTAAKFVAETFSTPFATSKVNWLKWYGYLLYNLVVQSTNNTQMVYKMTKEHF